MLSETKQMFGNPHAQASPTSMLSNRTNQSPLLSNPLSPQEKLPDIYTESPRKYLGADTQIVPYEQKKAQAPYITYSNLMHDSIQNQADQSEKFEMRLHIAEKSNRALFEEVLRLQNQLNTTFRNNENIVKEEQRARQQLEDSVRSTNEITRELNEKILKTEQKLNEERNTLTSLVNHTKQVEQAVITSQQQILTRKDAQGSRIEALREELIRSSQSKQSLENATATLTEQVRVLKSQLEEQAASFSAVHREISLRTKRLEEDSNFTATAVKLHEQQQSHSQENTSQLRGQIDTRLSELRDIITDLRSKGHHETENRHNLEQQIRVKINDVSTMMADLNHKKDAAIHALELVLREKEHELTQRCMDLEHKITQTSEETNRRLISNELKLRDHLQEKFINIDKMIQEIKASRLDFEQDLKNVNENNLQSLKKTQEDEIAALKDSIKVNRSKTQETLLKLNVAISLVEKQIKENKRHTEKVLTAEIKSRKSYESQTHAQIEDVRNKVQLATASLQQAIGEIHNRLSSPIGNIQRSDTDLTLIVTDLGKDLRVFERKVDNLESGENCGAHLSAKIQQLSDELDNVNEKIKSLSEEIKLEIYLETNNRIKDIEDIKGLVTSSGNVPNDTFANADLKNGVKTLAETMQTIKVVLGMKLQSEQKLRTEEVNDLNTQVAYLRALIEPLVNLPPQPRLFVKDKTQTRAVAEKAAPNINKWSVYNAYRWLRWKVKLSYIHWSHTLAAEKNQDVLPEIDVQLDEQPDS